MKATVTEDASAQQGLAVVVVPTVQKYAIPVGLEPGAPVAAHTAIRGLTAASV